VNKLELLLHAVHGLAREGAPALLRHDASVAELLNMVDHRYPAHHGLLTELVKRLEVEVAEPLMPAPGFIIFPCSEAEWSRRLEVEDIEVAQSVANLDKKPPAPIPNPEHALVDLRLRAAFIELAKAHDGIAQRRDVDVVQRTRCSLVLPWNTIEPTPWISTLDASPNRTEP
jgi:hypothetical protein